MKRKFSKSALVDLLNEDSTDLEIVEDTIQDTSRWSIRYLLVFKEIASNKFYSVGYSRGATEYQDEGPFEFDPEEIECYEVEPTEVMITKFTLVKGPV